MGRVRLELKDVLAFLRVPGHEGVLGKDGRDSVIAVRDAELNLRLAGMPLHELPEVLKGDALLHFFGGHVGPP